MNHDEINIKDVLSYIDPSCSHDDWIKVGMALKEDGYSYDVFRDWSSQSKEKFSERDCLNAWMSFKKTGISIGTLIWMAQSNGYTSPDNKYYEENGKQYKIRMEMKDDFNGTLYFDELDNDLIIKDEGWLKPEEFFEPTDYEWNPKQELINYLEALFEPSDIIAYTTQTRENANGKLAPYTKGVYGRKAIDLINILKEPDGTIEKAIGTYDKRAGVWIRINPFDGLGVDDANVVSYKHVLVESDEIDISKQIAILKALKLPISALVFSGGKSVHAVVKVDAPSQREYKRRVDFIYETCNKNGLKTDTSNKNESRLSRMPGVVRGNHKQFLIATDLGFQNYEQWQEWVENETDELPDPEEFSEVWDNPPELAPELIQGVLRKGHKMLLSGGSKTGKSMLMIQLACAIASGGHWLNKKCDKGKVLYLNLEIDRPSFLKRVIEVCKRKGYSKDDIQDNLSIWHLRGYSAPLDVLAPKLIRRCKKEKYIAVIIDPIYKVMMGDENKAGDMANFSNQFDVIANALDCSVIYVHHFTKGAQDTKASIDRASGSGVFARDPDAILTITSLKYKSEKKAARVEFTVREFADVDAVNVWYEYPVHVIDENHELDNAKIDDGKGFKKSALETKADLLLDGFYFKRKYNEEKKRFEAPVPDVIKWMHQQSQTKQDFKTYRSNFDKDYKQMLDNDITPIMKDSPDKVFESGVFYQYEDKEMDEE